MNVERTHQFQGSALWHGFVKKLLLGTGSCSAAGVPRTGRWPASGATVAVSGVTLGQRGLGQPLLGEAEL